MNRIKFRNGPNHFYPLLTYFTEFHIFVLAWEPFFKGNPELRDINCYKSSEVQLSRSGVVVHKPPQDDNFDVQDMVYIRD